MSEKLENEFREDFVKRRFQEKENYIGYGGFWRRLAAFWIDVWPIWILGYVSAYLTLSFGIRGVDSDMASIFLEGTVSIIAVLSIIGIIYNLYVYLAEGASVGHRILGLKIISVKTDKTPSRWVMFGRLVAKMTVFAHVVGLCLAIASLFMVGLREKKQSVHDLVCGTAVMLKEEKNTWVIWGILVIPPLVMTILVSAKILANLHGEGGVLSGV